MTFSQSERISISKKIVSIEEENAAQENVVAAVIAERDRNIEEDSANRTIQNRSQFLINEYETEIARYNGEVRLGVTEQLLLDGARKINDNLFFPNNSNTQTPFASDNIWKNFQPLLLSAAIGKNIQNQYPTFPDPDDYELFKIDAILNKIGQIESDHTGIQRATGQVCVSGTPDTLQPKTDLVEDLDELIPLVEDLRDYVQATEPLVVSSEITAPFQVQAQAARDYILNTLLPGINAWLALPNFVSFGTVLSCSSFNSTNPATRPPSKLRTTDANEFKALLEARETFLGIRISQINSRLGTVVQNINTGDITSTTGLYGERARVIDIRLNLIGGSLSKVVNAELGIQAVQQIQQNNANAGGVYQDIMFASKLLATTDGSNILHVEDASQLTVGRKMFLVSETKPELSLVVQAINGNAISVNKRVPATYRESELARIYFEL